MERPMSEEEVLKERIAQLESRVDLLETEFDHLDRMLKQFGFEEGIKTLAEALNEVISLDELFKKGDSE